jgi:Tfp pilus assembly protein PilN
VIRSNLSTRPFYNERAVNRWLGLAAVIVAALTVFNVSRVLHYSRSDTELKAKAAADEARAVELRASATDLKSRVDPAQMQQVSAEAQLANDLIARRAFSWTELFNQFEQTLPQGVRITAVRPEVQDGRRVLLEINVIARGVADVNEFMENLEGTRAFVDALSRDERVGEQEQLEASIATTYTPVERAGGGTSTGLAQAVR